VASPRLALSAISRPPIDHCRIGDVATIAAPNWLDLWYDE